MESAAIVVFGPQIGLPEPSYLSEMYTVLTTVSSLHPIVDAINDLTRLWRCLTIRWPHLSTCPAEESIHQLQAFFHGRNELVVPEKSPNSFLTTLTVLTQIAEYYRHMRFKNSTIKHPDVLVGVQSGSFQGNCIGLLTAIIMSCAADDAELGRLGANALRLAFLIGVLVDLDCISSLPHERPVSFTVRSEQPKAGEMLERILVEYPQVSALF